MTSVNKIKGLKLLQWNCHSIRNKREVIINIIINDYDILALSETWLDSHINFNLANFNILRKDGPSSKSGGLILAIKKHIPYQIVDYIHYRENTLESLAITIPPPRFYYDYLYLSTSRFLLPFHSG